MLPVPEIPPGIVHADRRDFGLALLALLFNAAEAMSEKGGELSVRVFLDADGWGFAVGDQGPGIPPDKLNHLFEPFTRGDTHGQSGSGLGLFIARQAADVLGAKLWADSKPGGGTAFHLELPAS